MTLNSCVRPAVLSFWCEWANVQPHSGAQANAAVMLATLKLATLFWVLASPMVVTFRMDLPLILSGLYYDAHFYGVQQETGRIDMDNVARIAHTVRPKLLICGASAYARDWDYARFREIADEVGALLLADIAHTAGLIATGQLNNPMPYCHIVTSTTHKTLRGPRGGIIMLGKDYLNPMGKTTKKGDIRKMSSVLDSGVFPGTQGGPLNTL